MYPHIEPSSTVRTIHIENCCLIECLRRLMSSTHLRKPKGVCGVPHYLYMLLCWPAFFNQSEFILYPFRVKNRFHGLWAQTATYLFAMLSCRSFGRIKISLCFRVCDFPASWNSVLKADLTMQKCYVEAVFLNGNQWIGFWMVEAGWM